MNMHWLDLWRDLVNSNPRNPNNETIKRYRDHVSRGRQRPDPLLDFVVQSVDSQLTVLDIGAGNGRWTIPLAGRARTVTAIEPDGEMLNALRENVKTAQGDIQIIPSSWEEANVGGYDIVVCAHAMYSSPDLAFFVHKMEKHARKTCYLALRLPPADGVIGELSTIIYGRLYDSVNALIAYNALYSLGIYANVLVEKDIYPWTNDTIEEAFLRAKRHLHLESIDTHDRLIRDTLYKRLTRTKDGYIWPDGMRSALIWWNPAQLSQ